MAEPDEFLILSYTENRIRLPDERVRFPNLLTAKDLFGQNHQIRKRHRPTDLPAYRADRGYRPVSLLTKLGDKDNQRVDRRPDA